MLTKTETHTDRNSLNREVKALCLPHLSLWLKITLHTHPAKTAWTFRFKFKYVICFYLALMTIYSEFTKFAVLVNTRYTRSSKFWFPWVTWWPSALARLTRPLYSLGSNPTNSKFKISNFCNKWINATNLSQGPSIKPEDEAVTAITTLK